MSHAAQGTILHVREHVHAFVVNGLQTLKEIPLNSHVLRHVEQREWSAAKVSVGWI